MDAEAYISWLIRRHNCTENYTFTGIYTKDQGSRVAMYTNVKYLGDEGIAFWLFAFFAGGSLDKMTTFASSDVYTS